MMTSCLKSFRVIKEKEDQGYSYDVANASFELLALEILGEMPSYFTVKRYRVGVERRKNNIINQFLYPRR